jgi:hypothetical protein
MSNDARISPRYALLVADWHKWVGVAPLLFLLAVFAATSFFLLVFKESLWGLGPIGYAIALVWLTWPAFRILRDPLTSYVELTGGFLVVMPVATLMTPVSVAYSEVESVRLAGGCGWSLLQYPYPVYGAHVDVVLTRAKLIVGNRGVRRPKVLHLKVGEPERFLSELSARTGR